MFFIYPIQNNLCEFKTYTHKFKRLSYNKKQVKASFADF